MQDGIEAAAKGDAIATDQVQALDESPPTSLAAAARGTGLALRRRRGLVGDVRYFVGAFFGLSRARRERDRLEARLAEARARRERAVVALAAQAVSTTSLAHPALDDARAALAILEHDHGEHDRERSETAGAAFNLRREHEEHSRARLTEITSQEEALAALATGEASVERDVARAEAQARLDAARAEFRARAEQLDADLRALAARTEALDRADQDARRAREACLAALGETLVLERPAMLRQPLGELDELEAAIATDQRRLLDLDELIDGVDRRTMARGGAVLLGGVVVLLVVVWLVGRS